MVLYSKLTINHLKKPLEIFWNVTKRKEEKGNEHFAISLYWAFENEKNHFCEVLCNAYNAISRKWRSLKCVYSKKKNFRLISPSPIFFSPLIDGCWQMREKFQETVRWKFSTSKSKLFQESFGINLVKLLRGNRNLISEVLLNSWHLCWEFSDMSFFFSLKRNGQIFCWNEDVDEKRGIYKENMAFEHILRKFCRRFGSLCCVFFSPFVFRP